MAAPNSAHKVVQMYFARFVIVIVIIIVLVISFCRINRRLFK